MKKIVKTNKKFECHPVLLQCKCGNMFVNLFAMDWMQQNKKSLFATEKQHKFRNEKLVVKNSFNIKRCNRCLK